MARRLHQTLADYVVVAISPALIMVLVGSLVFFLLEVFYQGEYQARLQFIFALFVMAAVLIGRISMEEGTGYAAMFAVPLAIVTGLAIMRFVEIQGAMAAFSLLINWGLLALVWWCTHQLTWDCTLIDESQDASGQGLLQTVGLERGAERDVQKEAERDENIAGTTSRVDIALSWWQWFLERQRRPHAPGVWVVYFSLAALPLFGIGQWFIPADDLESRRYVFWLLFLYVASGLGLLVTTSFLGLRRYLRQRQLQMPAEMAGAWLGVGAVLIVALLAAAWLLPRPGAEYSITQIPITFGSPDLDPSPYGVGNDGPQADDASATTSSEDSQDAAPSQEQGAGDSGSEGGEQSQSSDGSQAAEGSQSDDQSGSSGSDQGGQNSDGSQGESTKKDDDGKQQQAENSSSGPQPQTQKSGSGRNDNSAPRESQPASAEKSADESSREAGQGSTGKTSSSFQPQQVLQQAASWLPMLLKWLFYLILFCVAAYFIWRYWETVRTFLSQFLNEMRELWDKLFGRKSRSVEEAAAAAEGPKVRPPRPFSDFADPFAAGLAARWSAGELVKYSFEAFEAWAREHDCPRQPDQTPHEFAALVGARQATLARDSRNLADLYCQAAYAKEALSDSSAAHMKKLWQHLRAGERQTGRNAPPTESARG